MIVIRTWRTSHTIAPITQAQMVAVPSIMVVSVRIVVSRPRKPSKFSQQRIAATVAHIAVAALVSWMNVVMANPPV